MVQDQNNHIQNTMEVSTFYLGQALMGINILDIHEINRHFEITKVPQASDWIEGLLNLRGRIVTVIDLGKKLGLSRVKKSRETRNLIVNSRGEQLGLLVDAIGDVFTAKQGDMEPSPSNIGNVQGKFFQGVLKAEGQLIGILNLDEILDWEIQG